MKTRPSIILILLLILANCSHCGSIKSDQANQCSNSKPTDKLIFYNWFKDSSKPIKVYYDENQTPEILSAIEMWNSTQDKGNEIFIKNENPESSQIEVYDYNYAINNNLFSKQLQQFNNPDLAGISFRNMQNDHCIILSKSDTWYLLSHELGHCLGFTHDPDTKSIMYPCPNFDNEITNEMKIDLNALQN